MTAENDGHVSKKAKRSSRQRSHTELEQPWECARHVWKSVSGETQMVAEEIQLIPQWARNLKREGGFLLWCVWMSGEGNDLPLVVAGQPLKVFSEGRVTSLSASAGHNCILAEKREKSSRRRAPPA